MARDLGPVTAEEKKSWMHQKDNVSYVKTYASLSREFFRTSCLLTAAVLRYRLTGHYDFVATDEELTADFAKRTPLFQVEFSLEAEDFDEHVITVCDSTVYQSYFRRFEFDVRPLHIPAGSPDRAISAEEFKKMLGVDTENTHYYRVTIPPA